MKVYIYWSPLWWQIVARKLQIGIHQKNVTAGRAEYIYSSRHEIQQRAVMSTLAGTYFCFCLPWVIGISSLFLHWSNIGLMTRLEVKLIFQCQQYNVDAQKKNSLNRAQWRRHCLTFLRTSSATAATIICPHHAYCILVSPNGSLKEEEERQSESSCRQHGARVV